MTYAFEDGIRILYRYECITKYQQHIDLARARARDTHALCKVRNRAYLLFITDFA